MENVKEVEAKFERRMKAKIRQQEKVKKRNLEKVQKIKLKPNVEEFRKSKLLGKVY